jgi:hypothetical protein
MPLFLRTLLSKPHLGPHVKKWIANSCNELAIEMEPLGEENLDLLDFLILYLMGWKVEDHKKWYQAARNGSWDTLAAIIISILLNPEEIHFVQYGYSDGYSFLGAVLERVRHFQDMEPKDIPVLDSGFRLADLERNRRILCSRNPIVPDSI